MLANSLIGMAKTGPATRTIHVNIDPSQVRSLLSKLSKTDAVAVTDGGCDTGLLGAGWYITEYTGRYAHMVGFDEFIAKKSGLPIVIGITKYSLPDGKGHILLQHNEGVYNKGSRTTLLSEFQLRTRRCIVDSSYKGHCGANYKPGTQRLETPDDEGEMGYPIPLTLWDALMTFWISLPTEEDLVTLPIVDITPTDVWCPSDFNKTGKGLSFEDSLFDPPTFAQLATRMEPEDTSETFHDTLPNLSFEDPGSNPVPTPDNDAGSVFHDAQTDLLPNDGHYFDPADSLEDIGFLGRAFHLTLDAMSAIDSFDVDHFLMTLDHVELRGEHEDFDSFAYISKAASNDLETFDKEDTLNSLAFVS